jgi:hypothetical protein
MFIIPRLIEAGRHWSNAFRKEVGVLSHPLQCWDEPAMTDYDLSEQERSDMDETDSTETTTIHLAGNGSAWKDELQSDERYADANVTFVTLLDESDGTLLKYEHGMERHDALTDDDLRGSQRETTTGVSSSSGKDDTPPVAVWWDEYGHQTSTVEGGYYSLEDAPSWVYDAACSIGVYEDRTVALTSLLSETGHGVENPYPCEIEDGDTDVTAVLYDDKPLVQTLAIFATYGLDTAIPRDWFNQDIPSHDEASIDAVLSFLDTLGVLDHNTDDEVMMTDDSRSHELLEDFILWYHGSPTPN